MRIAVISTSVFKVPLTNYGGLEQIAWLTAKGLAEKGHDVALVAPDGSECPGCVVIPTGPAGQWDERATYGGYGYQTPNTQHLSEEEQKKHRRVIEGYWKYLPQFECVIDHSWSKWSYMLKAEGKLKAPVLGVMHAPINTMWQQLPPVEKPCIVCISKDQAAHFEAIHNQPARVCYNGIDLDHYKPLGIPRTERFLFLARFSTIKGPLIAINSCREVGAELDLIGDTTITGEPEYYEQCRRAADGKQIRIVGGCSRGETVWWYSQAHAFCHPNKLFREPLGLAPLEAQAAGLPVICFDNGAMRETVRDGETGSLCKTEKEFTDSVRGMMGGNCITEAVRKRCQENAAEFSVQKMVSRYESLCVEAIEGGGW